MIRRCVSIAALVCACTSTAAWADTVTMTGYRWGSSSIDTSMTGTVGVGEFSGLLNGQSFDTYCTDVFESFSFNNTYNNYFVAANGTAYGFTHAQASMLGRLYTVADALVDTRDEAVAFQLAVWEVLYDATYQVKDTSGRGNFYVQDGGNLAQQDLANHWLADAKALSTSQFNVARLASVDAQQQNGHQDFILVSQVPEPATPALMLAGLAGLGWFGRRRRAAA